MHYYSSADEPSLGPSLIFCAPPHFNFMELKWGPKRKVRGPKKFFSGAPPLSICFLRPCYLYIDFRDSMTIKSPVNSIANTGRVGPDPFNFIPEITRAITKQRCSYALRLNRFGILTNCPNCIVVCQSASFHAFKHNTGPRSPAIQPHAMRKKGLVPKRLHILGPARYATTLLPTTDLWNSEFRSRDASCSDIISVHINCF